MDREKNIFAVCFLLHFALILLISVRQGTSDVGRGETILPHAVDPVVRRVGSACAAIVGESMPLENFWRQTIAAYSHLAGLDTGYGFFAPTVSISHKLVFEIRYPDGHTEYELPAVSGVATGVRMPLLFDNIAHTPYDLLRETMLKVMAFAVWQQHPDAEVIRAVFGYVRLPTISDFEKGRKESYEVLFAYDFRFPKELPSGSPP